MAGLMEGIVVENPNCDTMYRTQFFGQVAALNQAAFRVSFWRTSAGV
jgi:hypothetical protein